MTFGAFVTCGAPL